MMLIIPSVINTVYKSLIKGNFLFFCVKPWLLTAGTQAAGKAALHSFPWLTMQMFEGRIQLKLVPAAVIWCLEIP